MPPKVNQRSVTIYLAVDRRYLIASGHLLAPSSGFHFNQIGMNLSLVTGISTSLMDESWYWLTAILNFGVLKKFKLHTVFWTLLWGHDSGADKTFTTHQSGGRVQVWVQVPAPASHLAITPKGDSRRQSKDLTTKSMAKLLGPHSSTAWAGWTGKHKHRAFSSLLHCGCWQRLARLRKASILQEYHSCNIDSVQESKKFCCFVDIWPLQVTFFKYEMKFSMELATYASKPQRRFRDFCSSISELSELWRALNFPSQARQL